MLFMMFFDFILEQHLKCRFKFYSLMLECNRALRSLEQAIGGLPDLQLKRGTRSTTVVLYFRF